MDIEPILMDIAIVLGISLLGIVTYNITAKRGRLGTVSSTAFAARQQTKSQDSETGSNFIAGSQSMESEKQLEETKAPASSEAPPPFPDDPLPQVFTPLASASEAIAMPSDTVQVRAITTGSGSDNLGPAIVIPAPRRRQRVRRNPGSSGTGARRKKITKMQSETISQVAGSIQVSPSAETPGAPVDSGKA